MDWNENAKKKNVKYKICGITISDRLLSTINKKSHPFEWLLLNRDRI
jgi:hypothetical protein